MQTAQGPSIGFSAANDCTAAQSTRPSVLGHRDRRGDLEQERGDGVGVQRRAARVGLGFDTQSGHCNGTFGPAAPGGRNGQQGTLSWTYFNGSPDSVQFTLRDSSNTVVYSATEQAPGAFRGSPGGVWTLAP